MAVAVRTWRKVAQAGALGAGAIGADTLFH